MSDTMMAAGRVLERIEARLDRIDQSHDAVLRVAGLPADLLDRLRAGTAAVPRGPKLVRLAEALGTSVSYLVGLDPDTPPPPELLADDQGTLGLLAADEEAMLQAYRRLDVPSRAAALHVLMKMAGPEPQVQSAVRRAKR